MTTSASDIEALHARVVAAIVGLAAVPADDPAAMRARHALRLTQHTLECFWLPTLANLGREEQYDDV